MLAKLTIKKAKAAPKIKIATDSKMHKVVSKAFAPPQKLVSGFLCGPVPGWSKNNEKS